MQFKEKGNVNVVQAKAIKEKKKEKKKKTP